MIDDDVFPYLSSFNTSWPFNYRSFHALKKTKTYIDCNIFVQFLGGVVVFQCIEFVLCVCVFTGKMMALASNLMNQKLENHLQMVLKYVISSLGVIPII